MDRTVNTLDLIESVHCIVSNFYSAITSEGWRMGGTEKAVFYLVRF